METHLEIFQFQAAQHRQQGVLNYIRWLHNIDLWSFTSRKREHTFSSLVEMKPLWDHKPFVSWDCELTNQEELVCEWETSEETVKMLQEMMLLSHLKMRA